MRAQAFGSARWDAAYSANDRTPFTSTWGRTTTSADFTLVAKDTDVTVASSTGFSLGEVVVVYDATGGEKVHMRVVAVPDATHLTLRPLPFIRSTTGTPTQPYPFGNTISSGAEIDNQRTTTGSEDMMPQRAHALTIDLTEAPAEETYTYLLLVAATSYSDTASKQWILRTRSQTQVDDPYETTGSHATYHEARYTQNVASEVNGDRYPYNSAFIETLSAGDRWTFSLEMSTGDSGHTVTVENMRIMAIRVDTTNALFVSAGSGGAAQDESTTTSATYIDSVQITVPSGSDLRDDYIVVACATIGSTTSQNTDCLLDVDGVPYAGVRRTFLSGDDLQTVAAMVVDDGFNVGDTITWKFRANSGTAKISQPFLALIPIEAVPGLEAFERTASINIPSVATSDFDATNGSRTYTGATALEEGSHLLFLNYEGGGSGTDLRGFARPRYSTDPTWIYHGNRTPRGWAGLQHDRASAAAFSTFWFHRAQLTGDDVTVSVDHRIAPGDTADMTDNNVQSFAIRERAKFQPASTDPVTIAAEVDVGAIYEAWTSQGSDIFDIDLPDVAMVSAIKVNADTYTRVWDVSDVTTAKQWYWNTADRSLRIKMDTGDAPTDPDRTVVVRSRLFFARDHVGLTWQGDASDSTTSEDLPYEPRIEQVPTYSQTLTMAKGSVEVAASIGQLVIAASDGKLDYIPAQELLKGARITVLRGYSTHSTDRIDYDIVTAATGGEPRLDRETLTITLYGQHVELERPINTTHMTVYEAGEQREDQVVPTIYGCIFRAPAFRITHTTSGGDTNTYKIASHALEDIITVYEDPDDPRTAVTTVTKDLPNGQVSIVNHNLPSWNASSTPDAAPDVLYCNVVGYAETIGGVSVPVETPGRIVRHLLSTYAGITDFDEYALRALDTRWRQRMDTTTSPYGRLLRPPTLGLYLDADQTVVTALEEVARAGHFYLVELRSGRISVGVPEIIARNAIGNAGFETNAAEGWPWRATGSASFATTIGKVYQGARSAQVSGGTRGFLDQTVDFHRSGSWAVSALVALEEGVGSAFRLGVLQPGDGFNYTYSDPAEITSTEWTRVNVVVDLISGESGQGEVRLIPFHPEATDPIMPVTSDLKLWLKADAMIADGDVTSGDGDSVATWTDQSGNGNDYTQGTAANQPTYRTNVRAGHPAVWFDRANDTLTQASVFTLTQPYTISVACCFADDAADFGSTARFRNVIRDSAGGVILGARTTKYAAYDSAPANIFSTDTLESHRWVVLTYVVDGSGREFFLDGTSEGTDANNSGFSDLQISVSDTDGYMMGFVGEVLVWDKALSTAEREAVEDYLFGKWGIRDVSINVDNVWCVPAAIALETVGGENDEAALNFAVEESEVRPDVYYEAEIPYNPFVSGSVPTPTRYMTDQEARALTSTYDPEVSESRTTDSTARRIFLENVIVSNEDATEARESASGIAADIALNFSRMRAVLRGTAQGIVRLPAPGEVLYHPPTAHVPNAASAFPFWMLTQVDDGQAATEVQVEAEREIDPVKDRRKIGSLAFPAGALALSLTDAAITGYAIVTGPQGGYFKAVAGDADLNVSYGSVIHGHWLPHTHTMPAHTHTWVGTPGASNDTKYFGPDDGEASYYYPTSEDQGISYTDPDLEALGFNVVVSAARGYSDGDHSHAATAATTSGAASTTTSGAASPTFLASGNGSNELKHYRVTVRRRTGSDDEIPTNIVIGYITTSANAPAGWTRETALDGYYLKGSTAVAATPTTTLTTNWTPADSSTLPVASASNMLVGTRLSLVDGGSTTHVLVSAIGSTVTVELAAETGDDNGHTYASATTTVTSTAETVGSTFSPTTHNHWNEVDSHTHTSAHSHARVSATSGASTPMVNTTCVYSLSPNSPNVLFGTHTHDVKATLTSTTPTSSSATGSGISDVQYVANTYELMWIRPSATGVTQLPANAVLLFDGTTPPNGWEVIAEADGMFLKGAEAAAAPTGGSIASHAHVWNPAAHTLSHTHTGSGRAWYLNLDTGWRTFNAYGPIHGPDMWLALHSWTPSSDAIVGHAHFASIGSVSTTDPGLSAATSVSTWPSTTEPRHCRVRLIKKL